MERDSMGHNRFNSRPKMVYRNSLASFSTSQLNYVLRVEFIGTFVSCTFTLLIRVVFYFIVFSTRCLPANCRSKERTAKRPCLRFSKPSLECQTISACPLNPCSEPYSNGIQSTASDMVSRVYDQKWNSGNVMDEMSTELLAGWNRKTRRRGVKSEFRISPLGVATATSLFNPRSSYWTCPDFVLVNLMGVSRSNFIIVVKPDPRLAFISPLSGH